MPPAKSEQCMPMPAPICPSPTASVPVASSAAAISAASGAGPRTTSTTPELSHSPTTGMITSSTPMPRWRSPSTWVAAWYTAPTYGVAVRKTGVSMTPHSRIWIEPVSSPAPFRTATPA